MGESEIISVSCPRCGSKQANKIEETIAVCMGCGAKLEIRKKQSNQTANEKAESVVENNKVNVEQPKPIIAVEEKTNLIKEKKTMEESKNLKLARQARAEDNSEDAKLYYGKVREEDPENGEAKYFYAYFSLYEGTNGELPKRFINLCSTVTASVKLVGASSMSKEEQLKSVAEIVDSFVPEVWTENRYMNKKNTETKIGDSYVKVFDTSAIISCCKNGLMTLKALGDQIEKLYIADAECKRLAVIVWKEYVALSHKWYAYAVKGDAEIYAEKIKKVDPSYEMPKKAGCISFSNKK